MIHTRACIRRHTGGWCAPFEYIAESVEAIRKGVMAYRAEPKAWDDDEGGESEKVDQPIIDRVHARVPAAGASVEDRGRLLYMIEPNAVAIVPIFGVMMKGESKFSGTVNSQRLIRAFETAASDKSVNAIMSLVDSPGGQVAGGAELIDAIKAAGKIKPVETHVEDECCSAAQWAAFATSYISAGRNSLVGSVGAVWVMVDESAAAEMEGIKVIPMTTGEFKAAGAPGVPVTEEVVQYYQSLLFQLFGPFKADAIKRMGSARASKVIAEAKVYHATDGVELGLIDKVSTLEEAIEHAAKSGRQAAAARKASASVSAARALVS